VPPDRRITLDGFLRAFQSQDQNQPDHPFCFVLGAGASKPSGIRTGAELARIFIEEIHQAENFENEPIEKWATSERLGIKNFHLDQADAFYPELYQRKFGEHPDQGYAFLEKEMEDREPSYGYSVLAWILAQKPHKVVITTNFDNLVADALSIHSTTFPRVVGHDSLAGFVQAALRRPLIAKIHGDLGFTPRNTPKEIAQLSQNWKTALQRVLERFTPIVVGYGGNDGSLMATLESLPDGVPESIYWCHREGPPASPRVMKLLERRKGRLVIIPGFDELMLKLQDHMRLHWRMPNLLEEMEGRQRQREKFYKEQRDKIGALLTAPQSATRLSGDQTPFRDAGVSQGRDLADAAVRVLAPKEEEKPWWQWYLEADREADLDKRDKIFRAGLDALPENPELLVGYAIFLTRKRGDLDRAEQLFKRAIEIDPNSADILGDYAVFLRNDRKDIGRAEEFYKRAIDANPNHANNLSNYANLLAIERQDLDRAEEFYQRAIDADPAHAKALGNYGAFLESQRSAFDRATELYKRALEVDPLQANTLGNYAGLLLSRGQREAGMEVLERAEAIEHPPPDLGLELLFYRLAHADQIQSRTLGKLKVLLEGGARSPDWPLERNIERAERDGYPNPALLRAIAAVISNTAPLESLDAFPEWRDAKPDSAK
jgi:Tfp pilus assembly protein PilF/NAD-dependent SIR2 family protein deacetylase